MLNQSYFRTFSNNLMRTVPNLQAMVVSGVGVGLVSLLLVAAGCGSDSKPDAGTAGKAGASTGGSSAGSDSSQSGSSSESGESSGGSGTSGSSMAGSSSAGSSKGGAAAGGETSSGGGIWGCVEAGGACICQNNTDKEHESVCTGSYECCVTVPFAGALRCQCQDPGDAKCEAPAGSGATVVDKCPPP